MPELKSLIYKWTFNAISVFGNFRLSRKTTSCLFFPVRDEIDTNIADCDADELP